jgi:hypothetical protein
LKKVEHASGGDGHGKLKSSLISFFMTSKGHISQIGSTFHKVVVSQNEFLGGFSFPS